MKRAAILTFLTILLSIFVAKGQDTGQLVAELHTHLHEGHIEEGRITYEKLKKKVAGYMGFYSGTFDLYMSFCTNQLNLTIGQDEVTKFHDMCVNANNINNRTKAKILYEIAHTLCAYGQSSLGLSYYQGLLNLESDIEPIYFYRYLMDIGWAYNQCQMPQKAFLTFKRCADYYKEKFGISSKNYAKALNAMVYVARFINMNYLDLLQTEHDIYVSNGDTTSNQYAICLDNFCSYYNKQGDLEQAIVYALKANRIFENISPNGRDFAISLNNIGAIYKELSVKDSSFAHLAEQFLIRSMEIEPTVSAALNLALFYDYQMGLPDKAMEYYDRLGNYNCHNVYAMQVGNHYANIGDYATYASYMEEYINYIRMVQQQNVPFMSASERSAYIKLVQNEKMEQMFDLAAESRHESLPGLCFNYLLMSKSLLLSYDANIDKIIRYTKDKELKEMHFSLCILRQNLERDPMLKDKVDSLEHIFLDKLYNQENFSAFTNLEYQDIQKCLTPDDAVVEFFENTSFHSPRLYAVILTANNRPTVIDCCSADEEKIWAQQNILTQFLWKSLEPFLNGRKRIYFTPDGSLYNYPFESELSLLCPKTELLRISSSRELVNRHIDMGNGAVIYGGLTYDMGIDMMVADARQYQNETTRGITDDVIYTPSIRYSVSELPPLPATLTEANNIAAIISTKTKSLGDVKTYLTDTGTETSFKSLSGQHKRILHIATHGFFNNLQEEELSEENIALTHSGLFLAGANNKYTEEYVPDSIDDGILTAKEISELDFRGMEFVGLSACQTAQGIVTSDGVFGLQRAFKKAGAQSILMSLWKVDDEATCLLMTEFYQNWISKKMTKHNALEEAKHAVRSHKEKGWDNPKYWAAFILLDGLN